uniref:Uncharacterized protein n=1 Tax=Romanomermis culicivorax TaxID=13658 RepID=A0A915IU21_ROMCU
MGIIGFLDDPLFLLLSEKPLEYQELSVIEVLYNLPDRPSTGNGTIPRTAQRTALSELARLIDAKGSIKRKELDRRMVMAKERFLNATDHLWNYPAFNAEFSRIS